MNKAQQLLQGLLEILKDRDEIQEIRTFGKIPEGKSDQYSDVDIRVLSVDPLLTQREIPDVIRNNISPIRKTFVIASSKGSLSEMYLLEDYSPYQKIDLGIERESDAFQFKNMHSVFTNDNSFGKDRDLEVMSTHRTVQYNLDDFLFGVPRLTKCLFREDFDLYRRWKSMTDAVLVLLEEKYQGFVRIQKKKTLNAPESKSLYSNLNKKDYNLLREILPVQGNLNISNSFYKCLTLYIQLSKRKAEHFKVDLDNEFIDYIKSFAKTEIERR